MQAVIFQMEQNITGFVTHWHVLEEAGRVESSRVYGYDERATLKGEMLC